MSRLEDIHAKGFKIRPEEYNRIKVGTRNLEDAVVNIGGLKSTLTNHNYTNKAYVLKAIAENDVDELRNISEFYYNINGIYQKVCNYYAYLYRYDWYVVPEVYDDSVKEDKVLKDFFRVLNFLDNSYIRKLCGDIALEVIRKGAYYGYIVPANKGLVIQQLPIQYCRSRYSVRNMPVVEFNMKFFDTFKDINYRLKILNLFPDEFKKGYSLYCQGKLVSDGSSAEKGWYTLDPDSTVKFNFNNNDTPVFVNAIPAILDLDAAQDLDRRKQMQQLLRIIVQKLPLDKNGDLIFDVDEARDIHENAVVMLARAIGVDILTTFAEIDSVDLSDRSQTAATDSLEKVERAVFNALGITQNIFNADGNLSVNNSVLVDESSFRNFLFQLNIFYDRVTQALSTNPKKYNFRLYMLETTQFNYRELAKMYKEQTQLGYSKMLPQIALGHSQSSILSAVKFENDILHLSEIMIPPLMSSTMSSEDILGNRGKTETNKSQKSSEESGRPELDDSQKSEKTIQNKESMS